jgi:hypothetical protein
MDDCDDHFSTVPSRAVYPHCTLPMLDDFDEWVSQLYLRRKIAAICRERSIHRKLRSTPTAAAAALHQSTHPTSGSSCGSEEAADVHHDSAWIDGHVVIDGKRSSGAMRMSVVAMLLTRDVMCLCVVVCLLVSDTFRWHLNCNSGFVRHCDVKFSVVN